MVDRAVPVRGEMASPRMVEAKKEHRPTYSLIVPTKDRSYHLGRRLPIWCNQGFEEVIVVDSSRDSAHKTANRHLCALHGARYLHAPLNRSEARNLGAHVAKGEWIFFTDDDHRGHASFHRAVMDRRVIGHDWVKTRESEVISFFNRDFFLGIGGYKGNLVLGEDDDLTARAIATGRGGLIDGVFEGIGLELDEREQALDFKRRLLNHMEYSFTLWEYLGEVPNPGRTAFSWTLFMLRTVRQFLQGDPRALAYFLGSIGGLFFGLLAKPLQRRDRRHLDNSHPSRFRES